MAAVAVLHLRQAALDVCLQLYYNGTSSVVFDAHPTIRPWHFVTRPPT